MSDNPIKDFEDFARDAVYAAVGLGVIGFQKAQVRRREIADALAERGVDVGEQVRAAGGTLRPPLEGLRPQIDAIRPKIDALRPQAEAIGVQLLAAAVALRPQFESLGAGVADLLKSVDEHAGPMRREVDSRVSGLEEHLPPGARAGFAQLRARASGPEETLHWLMGLLAPSGATDDSGVTEDSAATEGEEDEGDDGPPVMA